MSCPTTHRCGSMSGPLSRINRLHRWAKTLCKDKGVIIRSPLFTCFTNPIEHRSGMVYGKAVMLHQMSFLLAQLIAAHMKQFTADRTF